jgi:hypothetical protein
MMSRLRAWSVAWLAGGMMFLLASCGGGVSDGGPGGGEGAPTATGLVPNPGGMGAVLVADSAMLRPLLAGASWSFRDYGVGSEPKHVLVRHVAAAAGASTVTESRTDPPAFSVDLRRATNGDTLGRTEIPLRPGLNYRFEGPDLTQQLRIGQQIVVYDRRVADIGADIDGDTRVDGADIAGWRQVVGWEDLQLPGLHAPVRALRLDDVVVARLRGSASGAGPLTSSYGSTWYLQDVGIVRSVTWTDATQRTAQSDLRLLGFDGVDRGLGITSRQLDATPDCCAWAAFPGGFLTLWLQDLVWGDFNGTRFEYTPARRTGEGLAYYGQMLVTAGGARLIRGLEGTPNGHFQLDGIDARGRLAGEPLATLSTDVGGFFDVQFVAHRKASQIWMVFVQTEPNLTGDIRTRTLVARPYSDNGVPQGPGRRLALPLDPFEPPPIQVEALADGLLLLLDDGSSGGSGQRYRVVDLAANGTVRIDRTYLLDVRSEARVVAQGSDRWLLWAAPRSDQPGTITAEPAQGMRLGVAGVPVGVIETPGMPLDSRLPLSSRYWEGWPWNVVVQPNGWTIHGGGSDSPGPEFLSWQSYSWLGRLRVPAGDLRTHAEPSAIWVAADLVGVRRDGRYQPYMVLDDRTLYTGSGWGNWRGGFVIQWH